MDYAALKISSQMVRWATIASIYYVIQAGREHDDAYIDTDEGK